MNTEKELVKMKAEFDVYKEKVTDTINVLIAQNEHLQRECDKKDAFIDGLNCTLRRHFALEKIAKQS